MDQVTGMEKMTKKYLNKQLLALIEEYSTADIEITSSTEIYKDLKIFGDDADEFIQQYSEKFNVNLSNFEIGKYFPDEGNPTLFNLISFIFKKPIRTKYESITVNDLSIGIEINEL